MAGLEPGTLRLYPSRAWRVNPFWPGRLGRRAGRGATLRAPGPPRCAAGPPHGPFSPPAARAAPRAASIGCAAVRGLPPISAGRPRLRRPVPSRRAGRILEHALHGCAARRVRSPGPRETSPMSADAADALPRPDTPLVQRVGENFSWWTHSRGTRSPVSNPPRRGVSPRCRHQFVHAAAEHALLCRRGPLPSLRAPSCGTTGRARAAEPLGISPRRASTRAAAAVLVHGEVRGQTVAARTPGAQHAAEDRWATSTTSASARTSSAP